MPTPSLLFDLRQINLPKMIPSISKFWTTAAFVVISGLGLAGGENIRVLHRAYAESLPTEARYEVTGVIVALPGGPRAKNEILIKHAPIPEYRDQTGAVVGMMGMTMPFYLAPEVSYHELKVGDRVKFVIAARFAPRFTEQVESITKASD